MWQCNCRHLKMKMYLKWGFLKESLTKLLPDLHQNALLKFMAFLNAGSLSLPNS